MAAPAAASPANGQEAAAGELGFYGRPFVRMWTGLTARGTVNGGRPGIASRAMMTEMFSVTPGAPAEVVPVIRACASGPTQHSIGKMTNWIHPGINLCKVP